MIFQARNTFPHHQPPPTYLNNPTIPDSFEGQYRKKGKNAYYYAHVHGANGPVWDGKEEPRLCAARSPMGTKEKSVKEFQAMPGRIKQFGRFTLITKADQIEENDINVWNTVTSLNSLFKDLVPTVFDSTYFGTFYSIVAHHVIICICVFIF